MVKFITGKKRECRVVAIGLSKCELERIEKSQPIKIRIKDGDEIVLFHDRDSDAVAKLLKLQRWETDEVVFKHYETNLRNI